MWPTQAPHSRSDVLMEAWELIQCQVLLAAATAITPIAGGRSHALVCKAHALEH